MFFLMKGIMNFYEDAGEFMSYDSSEGGYLGDTGTCWNNWFGHWNHNSPLVLYNLQFLADAACLYKLFGPRDRQCNS
jgi:hypothetical protein